MTSGNKTTKFIISLLIIAVIFPTVLFSRPKKTEATFGWISDFFAPLIHGTTAITAINTGTQTSISLKNLAKEILKEVARAVARRALAAMTQSTINWINSGFHGQPLFVENPKSFFKDIAKTEIKDIIDIVGYDRLRFPFGRATALNTIASYKRGFEQNAQYTLSNVIKDATLLDSYRNNFYVGGWNGFLINTQYPQNNYIGYQLLYNEELARRLDGTIQNTAATVATTLQQGMGFLSPEVCDTNPLYNNLQNQFNRPRWNQSEYDRNNWFPPNEDITSGEFQLYEEEYQQELQKAKAEWAKTNDCPGNLRATTPGSVVAASINKALGGPQDLAIGGVNYGNSLSAIFDALLNKFIGDGLSKLASTINSPTPNEDNWDFEGNTLGVADPSGVSTLSNWLDTPDEVIVLANFKKEVADGIENTQKELDLMDNKDGSTPGLTQVFTQIWQQTRALDQCVPGPDIYWQNRLTEEMDKNISIISGALGKGEDKEDTTGKVPLVIRELKYAVRFFGDWVEEKMITDLPGSVIYIDAVDELETLSPQANQLSAARREKIQTLSRLNSLEDALADFSGDPEPGSNEEKDLITLRKEYNAIKQNISTSLTISNRKSELDTAKERYFRLDSLTTKCTSERVAKGWNPNGGQDSQFQNGDSEIKLYCDAPVVGGYPHEMFQTPYVAGGGFGGFIRSVITPPVLPSSPEYEFLPLVNAARVLTWDKWAWGTGDDTANVNMNCDIIFNANVLDYKGDLPGPTGIQERKPDWATNPGGGPPGGGGPQGACTALGQNEADFMLPLLRSGVSQDSVVSQTNSKFNLTTGNQAVYYASNNTIGLPEFYLAGHTDTDPGSPAPGEWNIVWRCGGSTPTPTPTPGGGSCGASNDPGIQQPIASDFSNVVFDSGKDTGEVANWPISNSVSLNSVTFPGNSTICLNHTMPWPSSWTQPATAGSYDGSVPASAWVFIWRGGQWHAATFDYYYKNGSEAECRDDGSVWSNAGFNPAFAPKTGETYGFMISGLARAGNRNISERTNLVMQQWAGRMCTSPSITPTPTPTPTTPDGPSIFSISPTTAQAGVTTIQINGTNLTTTVQFFDGVGNRQTVVGSVNSAKTQTTVLVPSGLPAGNVTVKIYKNANSVSNGILIQVGGGGTTPTQTILSSVDVVTGGRGGLAYNPGTSNWLVVGQVESRDSDIGGKDYISGRIMSNSGVPVTNQFKINPETGPQVMVPTVAYSPDINKYLVIWLKTHDPTGATLEGRFINPDGSLSGETFVVFEDNGTGGFSQMHKNSVLQYDSRNKKFVLVWEFIDRSTGGYYVGVKLATVSGTGVVSPAITVAPGTSNDQYAPSVAINESSNEYCVAYDERDAKRVVTRVVNAGTLSLGTLSSLNVQAPNGPAIVYNSVNKKYLIGWGDDISLTTKGRILNSCSITNGGSIFTLNNAGRTVSVAYNPKTNTYASIVQNQSDSGTTYNILSSSGTKLSGGVAFLGGFGNFEPIVAANPVYGTFAIIAAREYKLTRMVVGVK